MPINSVTIAGQVVPDSVLLQQYTTTRQLGNIGPEHWLEWTQKANIRISQDVVRTSQKLAGDNPGLTAHFLSALDDVVARTSDTKAAENAFVKQAEDAGIDRLFKAKLFIIGEPGAGKTSLAKKIKDARYQLVEAEKTTKGIDVIPWTFPMEDGKPFRVNIWNFGGQEICKPLVMGLVGSLQPLEGLVLFA